MYITDRKSGRLSVSVKVVNPFATIEFGLCSVKCIKSSRFFFVCRSKLKNPLEYAFVGSFCA